MTLEQAEELFQKYLELLNDGTPRGSRRNPCLLPAGTETILRAVRLLMARLHMLGQADESTLEPIIRAAMFIDTFSDAPFDCMELATRMQARQRQLNEFYGELLEIGRSDSFYWQRVYAMAGIECETKRSTFFQRLSERLGIRPGGPERVPAGLRHEKEAGQTTFFRRNP